MVRITTVEIGSLAEKRGVLPGDELLAVNGNEINDVLDYRFYLTDRFVTLSLLRGGDRYEIGIRKAEHADIGLEFETPLMDRKKTCRNRCVFCFIDQMPKGMRETLYFKDDDERLSFLHGNYVTLTNLTDHDIDRIIRMHLSPINVSVHTTNPGLRVKMMKNRRAGEVLAYLSRLADAGILLNCQIVLCRGINDGAELVRSLRELALLRPALQSVSVVPAGLTAHREGLYPLEPFTARECGEVIDLVNAEGEKMLEKSGERVFYPSDEFYLSAGRELPPESFYEDFPQLENGVGMLSLFRGEAEDEIERLREERFALPRERRISVATGLAAYGEISRLVRKMETVWPDFRCLVYPIRNDTFGELITVSGLLTGRDLAAQLAGRDLGEVLYFPRSALRSGENDFLCGMLPEELSARIGAPAAPAGGSGAEFVDTLLGVPADRD